jgi:hypothetical protein
MAGVDDKIVWPLTGNDDLIMAGLAPKDEDDTHEDTAALFGIDVHSGSAASINLDGSGGEGATTTRTPIYSNGLTPSVVGTGMSSGPGVGKRKSAMWADFDEIYETVNGRQISTKATYKMCKHTLSARSNAGTGRLKMYQKSCRQKTDQAARVQSRLAYNPDGFVHN